MLPLSKSASSADNSLGAIIPISQADNRSLEAIKVKDMIYPHLQSLGVAESKLHLSSETLTLNSELYLGYFPPRGPPARSWTARIPDKSFLVTNLAAVSLIQVNSKAGGCVAGSVPPFGAGLGSIPRWLLDAMTFSGCIPGESRKMRLGLLVANPSKEHIVISLANDSTQTESQKTGERNIYPAKIIHSLEPRDSQCR